VIGLSSAPIVLVALLVCAPLPAHADSRRQAEWWLSKLHVTQAWRGGQGAGVTVAVLADGVDASQPDLTGRVVAGPDFTRSGRIAGGPHYGVIGTGLASLIAGHGHGPKSASGTRADGIYGIAPGARILAVRVTLSPGDPLWSSTRVTSRLPADIADGIRYAVEHKASVIELPADPGLPGIGDWGDLSALAGGSAAERSAIAYAVSHHVVLVAPAGDNARAGDAPNYPAAYPGVIAVGSFGSNFVKAPYSCRRAYVALTAAGDGVDAASPGGYQTMHSTWAASATAAGIAALVRSQYPNLTAAQVMTAMAQGTVYQPRNGVADGSGYGTLDAQKAVARAAAMSPPGARPASLGALPRRQPVMPPVRTSTSIIESDLMMDGAISAGALAALLVLITWYGRVARRRERPATQPTAERDSRGRARADHGMPADPLLELFGPQHARPPDPLAGSAWSTSPRFQPRPGLTGQSTLASAFATRQMLPAPFGSAATQVPPGQAEPTSAAMPPAGAAGQHGATTGAETELRPAGMPSTLRHAPVSGSPPWEPAPQPTSELPWTAVRGPHAAGGRTIGRLGGATASGRSGPAESAWQSRSATASSAPGSISDSETRPAAQGGSGRDRRADPGPQPQAGAGQWADSGQQTPDSGNRPIYTWNPADSTDIDGPGWQHAE